MGVPQWIVKRWDRCNGCRQRSGDGAHSRCSYTGQSCMAIIADPHEVCSIGQWHKAQSVSRVEVTIDGGTLVEGRHIDQPRKARDPRRRCCK